MTDPDTRLLWTEMCEQGLALISDAACEFV
jgi:hypothetical protein